VLSRAYKSWSRSRLYKIPQNISSGRDISSFGKKYGAYPGGETADQPVLLDVPDSLDVVYGFVGVGLVTGTTGASGASGRSAVLFHLSMSQPYKASICCCNHQPARKPKRGFRGFLWFFSVTQNIFSVDPD
jgi:hypothetical protein